MVSEESIMSLLNRESTWIDYLEKKIFLIKMDPKINRYFDLYDDKTCRNVLDIMSAGTYTFTTANKKLISKYKVGKKRTVYSFNEYEMMGLRLLSKLLYRYDHLFSPNLFSFRINNGVKNAIHTLKDNKKIRNMYGIKVDIHDYFNSIDVNILLGDLKSDLKDDNLYELIAGILLNSEVKFNGRVIKENKGVMAGIPISPFLSNYYLKSMDEYFLKKKCTYMRYADDIILFAESEMELMCLYQDLLKILDDKKLVLNPKKQKCIYPGTSFDFLGFNINGDEIDISSDSVRKIKGKIRRSSKSIRRWMLEKDAPLKGTIKALIRKYNRKFYGFKSSELTWCLWYFPIITTSKSLHEIDLYLQNWIRYVATGRHTKKNYEIVPYSLLKECGYRSLVHEYYEWIKKSKNN